jgi:hypothetical protein
MLQIRVIMYVNVDELLMCLRLIKYMLCYYVMLLYLKDVDIWRAVTNQNIADYLQNLVSQTIKDEVWQCKLRLFAANSVDLECLNHFKCR